MFEVDESNAPLFAGHIFMLPGRRSLATLWQHLPFAHIFGGRRNPWKRPRLTR
jgi:hypothetical protein